MHLMPLIYTLENGLCVIYYHKYKNYRFSMSEFKIVTLVKANSRKTYFYVMIIQEKLNEVYHFPFRQCLKRLEFPPHTLSDF